MVTILCVSRNSIYKSLNCDAWDEGRNIFRCTPPGRVVCHPPCRMFSSRVGHQARPPQPLLEIFVAARCVHWLRSNGGILEQPARSKLGRFFGLGNPVTVQQSWWGAPTLKPTWLYFEGCKVPDMPFRLLDTPAVNTWRSLTPEKRAATPRAFAEWLISAAS